MAHIVSLAQDFKVIDGNAGPVTTNGGVASDLVSLKNAQKAWVVVQLTQAVGHATVVSIFQATDVAGTGVKAIANAIPIWENEATATSDALVAQTDAVSLTFAADIAKKMAIFEIDPAELDLANSFDCIKYTVSDSSQATNFVSGMFILLPRYAQSTPLSAIID